VCVCMINVQVKFVDVDVSPFFRVVKVCVFRLIVSVSMDVTVVMCVCVCVFVL